MTKTVPVRLAAVAVGVVVLIASGCGGQKPAASAGSAKSDPMVAFAQCVRSHGVPNFPDPKGGKMTIQTRNGKTTVNGVALNVTSQQFQAAQQACRSKLPAQTNSTANTAKLKQKALAFAQCMRKHGVKDFPDPKAGNAIRIGGGLSKGEMQSATFQAAQKACSGILPVPGQ